MSPPLAADHAGPTATSVFHLHPLLRCNLACSHCYSESSPAARAMLSRDQAIEAVVQAAKWGYQNVAVSGGEPLLYPWLADVLRRARAEGMTASVVTNGWLVDRAASLDALRQADVVAVSIDGLTASHNRLRGRLRAFPKVLAALSRLRDADIPFAVTCGITRDNLADLDELAARVHAAGAVALQLHPIEASGRAATDVPELVLQEEMAVAFYVLSQLLAAEYAGRMAIRADVVHRVSVQAQPSILYASSSRRSGATSAPSSTVGVLVLDPHGNLMPVCYGFAKSYHLGNVLESPMSGLWDRFLTHGGLRRLQRLGQSVYDTVAAGDGPDVFNPSDVLARASLRASTIAPGA